MPGQLGPISLAPLALQRGFHLQHVQHRNAFGDADDDLDAGVRRFQDRVGGERGRHVDHRGVRAGLPHRVAHGVEHRQAQMRLPALARRDAADHLRAVGNRLFGMEGALLAGEALADDLGVFVDEDAHFALLHRLFGRIGQTLGGDDRQPRFGQQLAPEFDIGAFQPHDHRHLDADFLHRLDDAFGDDVAAHDAAEDVDQHRAHLGVEQDDLEALRHGLRRGAAADVEEVGRRAAFQLDQVHRRHRQAGAVDHAADVAGRARRSSRWPHWPRLPWRRSGCRRAARPAPCGGTARCRPRSSCSRAAARGCRSSPPAD